MRGNNTGIAKKLSSKLQNGICFRRNFRMIIRRGCPVQHAFRWVKNSFVPDNHCVISSSSRTILTESAGFAISLPVQYLKISRVYYIPPLVNVRSEKSAKKKPQLRLVRKMEHCFSRMLAQKSVRSYAVNKHCSTHYRKVLCCIDARYHLRQ